MLIEAGGPGTAISVILSVTLPFEAVTVMVLATVGRLYLMLTCPFEPVIPGFGENVPPKPSVNVIVAFGTTLPTASLALTTSGAGRVFFFQAEDGIRDWSVTGVQTCALPI